jgi:phosphoserine phosphatase
MALALFDFDGTITYEDTFAPFIRYAVPTGRILAGAAALSPLLLGYELGLVRATSVRAAIVYAGLKGRNEAEVRVLGKRYAERLPGFVRARYQLTSYETVYAYGDTEEDRELLALASEPYFRWQRVAKGAR